MTDHPQADELARVWAELHPDKPAICCQCGKSFPIAGMGAPSITCPHCGFRPGEAACASAVKVIAKMKPSSPDPPDEPPPPAATPPMLADVIGNADAVAQLRMALDGHAYDLAKPGAKPAFPHTMLSGPGGTGKTLLAEIVARELGRKIHLQLGQTLNTPAKVADALLALKSGDVLFVDELHQLSPRSQEAFYRAMEGGILIPVTKAGVSSKPIRLPPFTLIGATTDEWSLLPSMCQRFKYRVRLQRMTPDEVTRALSQRAARSGWDVAPEAIAMIGQRSLGTPRLAVGLLDASMTAAKAAGGTRIGPEIVAMACAILGIDSMGLDCIARQYLRFLADAAGPVRVNVLASRLDGLSRLTVERKIEPDLLWLGLVEKQTAGRILTQAGRDHLRC